MRCRGSTLSRPPAVPARPLRVRRSSSRAAPAPAHAAVAALADARTAALEAALLAQLPARGRATGDQESAVLAAVAGLEAAAAARGAPGAAASPLLEGNWRLLFTSKSRFDARAPLGARVGGDRPGLEALFGAPGAASSSPVQRSIVENASFSVYQNIRLLQSPPCVENVVLFGDAGELMLRADASLPGAAQPERLAFRFSGGWLEAYRLPVVGRVRVPYPVPFDLLGDEAKGWLDTTYLSQRLRVSRGNKGTVFVLERAGENE